MNEFTNPLENIKIAAPCPANWDAMVGDDRKRFCGECRLNVYNLSGMTRDEAEHLLLSSEGRLCVRFYRRADGTILTKDCPVGWRALKQRVSKTATAFASMVFGILSGLGMTTFFSQSDKTLSVNENDVIVSETQKQDVEILLDVTESLPDYRWTVGRPSIPEYAIAGGIQNVDEVRRQINTKRKR